VAVWGIVNGVLDSTVKAVVADLLPPGQRAVGFGWLSLVRGAGLLVAGGVLGAAHDAGLGWRVVLALVVNVSAVVGLVLVLRQMAPARSQRSG
jgi:MFS family permease